MIQLYSMGAAVPGLHPVPPHRSRDEGVGLRVGASLARVVGVDAWQLWIARAAARHLERLYLSSSIESVCATKYGQVGLVDVWIFLRCSLISSVNGSGLPR